MKTGRDIWRKMEKMEKIGPKINNGTT
jgi:hypothetical protein